MPASDVLKGAWALLRPDLKQHRFSLSGAAARRANADGTVSLLSIQRSQKSTADRVLVCLNYGVFSGRVAAGMGDPAEQPPGLDRAHWRKRAHLGEDEWHSVGATDEPEAVAQVLGKALRNEVIPDLESRSGDDALRDEWLTGRSPGLTEYQRLLYLVILVHALGPADQLGACVAALRGLVAGTVHQCLVEFELGRLGLAVAG